MSDRMNMLRSIESKIAEIIELAALANALEPSVTPLTDAARRLLDAIDSTPVCATKPQRTMHRKFFDMPTFLGFVVEYFKPYIAPLTVRVTCVPDNGLVCTVQQFTFTIDNADECDAFEAVYHALSDCGYELLIEA